MLWLIPPASSHGCDHQVFIYRRLSDLVRALFSETCCKCWVSIVFINVKIIPVPWIIDMSLICKSLPLYAGSLQQKISLRGWIMMNHDESHPGEMFGFANASGGPVTSWMQGRRMQGMPPSLIEFHGLSSIIFSVLRILFRATWIKLVMYHIHNTHTHIYIFIPWLHSWFILVIYLVVPKMWVPVCMDGL